MAIVDKTTFEAVLVEAVFEDTVNIDSSLIGPLPEEDPEKITFVSLSASEIIPDINVIPLTSGDSISVTLSGNHTLDIFDQNEIIHITRGSSNKIEFTVIENSFENLNETRQIFSYTPDERTITVTYEIVYNSDIDGDHTIYVTQQVSNDYTKTIPIFLQYI